MEKPLPKYPRLNAVCEEALRIPVTLLVAFALVLASLIEAIFGRGECE